MPALTFIILKETFTLHRLKPGSIIPEIVFTSPFFSITRTAEEISILIQEQVVIESDKHEPGWKALKVAGPLDFSLTGILAGIATTLGRAGISIFAISTFDTDYILVKSEKLEAAQSALISVGHHFTPSIP